MTMHRWALCFLVAGCAWSAEPRKGTGEDGDTAALLTLEAKNPITLKVFSALGPQREPVRMRCLIMLSDRFGSSPGTMRQLNWSIQLSDGAGTVELPGFLRHSTDDAAVLAHLKDGAHHLAIVDINHSFRPEDGDAVLIARVVQWDSWADVAEAAEPAKKP